MIRRLARLSPEDEAAYRALVAPMTPAIERALGPEVLANRAAGRGVGPTTRLEPWRPARRAWRRWLQDELLTSPSTVLVTDVRRCYGSIRPAVLSARLVELGVPARDAGQLRALLERLGDGGMVGLPVGPAPSAILANAVLSVLDERLRGQGLGHVRWVDDVVALADGAGAALRAFDALRRAMDRVGLEPNAAKTAILRAPDLAAGRRLRSSGGAPCDDAAP